MDAIAEKTNAASTGEARKTTKPSKSTSAVPKSERLQPLAEGQSSSTTTRVLDDNKVETTFGFKMHKDATERYSKTCIFDFSNVSRAELLELATSNVRITIQGRLRKMGDAALNVAALAAVDVKSEVVDAEKGTTDDLTRAARSFARASNGMVSERDARAILEAQLAKKTK